ncbi:hypothetical protein KR222_002820, partial [Zaprionus bogoriensis]
MKSHSYLMDRWANRVAVVTGASAGIGAACCKELLARGMIVVGLARREIRLLVLKDELSAELSAEQAARFHYHKCDVSDERQVIEAFAWIDKTLGGADVLVNNAGVIRATSITGERNSRDLRDTVDTNVLGVAWCTREAYRSLERRGVNDGHVVIVNSLAGHQVRHIPGFSLNMYPPSKHAVTALTEVLRQEFQQKGTGTKITVSRPFFFTLRIYLIFIIYCTLQSVSPGPVKTEILAPSEAPNVPLMPMLRAEDVADAIAYSIQTPPNVQIHELIIRPLG